jgi:hypothetical protein
MPRYFFHLTNGDYVADEEGEEFDLVEAARGHAMAVARELSSNQPRLVGYYISVVDERGVVMNDAQNGAAPPHFADMAWSPRAEFGDGSAASPMLRKRHRGYKRVALLQLRPQSGCYS